MSRITALPITPSHADAPLTPAQKRFHSLLKQIEGARRSLADWAEHTAAFRLAYAEALSPLRDALIAGMREWAFALDSALAQGHWTRGERETMRVLIVDAAGDLLDALGDDAELKALFDFHADRDDATARRADARAMKERAETPTDLDEQVAGDKAASQATAGRRRPSAAQLRREDEARRATLSVREIYRKLASALHPDREPDPTRRDEKTALMQRVNQAYEARDLLALLELQLRIEQIDPAHLAPAGDPRLKHFNQVLAEQLGGLQAELDHVETAFRQEFGLTRHQGLDPLRLGPLLDETRRHWRTALHEQQRERRLLDDVAATRRWLRIQRQRRCEQADVPDPF